MGTLHALSELTHCFSIVYLMVALEKKNRKYSNMAYTMYVHLHMYVQVCTYIRISTYVRMYIVYTYWYVHILQQLA